MRNEIEVVRRVRAGCRKGNFVTVQYEESVELHDPDVLMIPLQRRLALANLTMHTISINVATGIHHQLITLESQKLITHQNDAAGASEVIRRDRHVLRHAYVSVIAA